MKALAGWTKSFALEFVFFLSLVGSSAVAWAGQSMTIESGAFEADKEIPQKYTCEGKNLRIPLKWSGIPKGTKSLVLIVDDPDAPDPRKPKMVWVHWILYDIPVSISSLPEGPRDAALPKGVRQGLNSWKKKVWGGPCPPIGRHRYFFKLFALDKTLGDLHEPKLKTIMKAMDSHILKKAELMGTYEKKAKSK